jgi:hypothetical protein
MDGSHAFFLVLGILAGVAFGTGLCLLTCG